MNPATGQEYEPIYLGARYKNSLEVHENFANKTVATLGQAYSSY